MHNAGNDAYCTLQAFLLLIKHIGNESVQIEFMPSIIIIQNNKV